MQKFIAREAFQFPDGATGWRPGGPFDCLGPFAKVQRCAVELPGGGHIRRTVYATSYADSFFSVPACTRYRGRYVGGFITMRDESPVFVPSLRHAERLADATPGE